VRVNFPRLTGLLLVALGMVLTVVGLVTPWAGSGVRYPDGSTIAGIALLVPLLSTARLAYGRLTQREPSVAAGIAALFGAVIATATAHDVGPSAGVGLGGPLTVSGAALATLGWVLAAVFAARSLRLPQPGVLVAAVLVALLGLDAAAVYWAVQGRFVDRTTGSAPAAPPEPPTLTAERWQRTSPGSGVLAVTGPTVQIQDPSGGLAVAAKSGRPVWRYRRSDLKTLTTAVVGDVVVSAYGADYGLLVTAHDTAGGRERFSRKYTLKNWHPDTIVSTLDGSTAVLAGTGADPGLAVALDPHTGTVRWTWTPRRDNGPCDVTGVAGGAATIGLALRCRANGVLDLVLGLSTGDGREQWSWKAPYTDTVPRGEALTLAPGSGGFFVQYGTLPLHAVYLAAPDGRPGTTLSAQQTGTGSLATVAGHTAVYVLGTSQGAELTGVNEQTGAPTWKSPGPTLIGWQLVAAASAPDRLYLLFTTRQPETASGPLRLVALDPATGQATGGHSLSCAIACLKSTVAVDAHSAVVATHTGTALTLTALG
jgi:hypothetical protein